MRLQAAAGPDAGGVDFQIIADSFSVGWITPFLPDRVVTDFGGKLTTPEEITITGTFADPILGGGATLSNGRLGLVATNLTYRDITAALELEGNRINVRDLSLRSGSGRADAEGTLQFEKLSVGDLDLRVNGRRLSGHRQPAVSLRRRRGDERERHHQRAYYRGPSARAIG